MKKCVNARMREYMNEGNEEMLECMNDGNEKEGLCGGSPFRG